MPDLLTFEGRKQRAKFRAWHRGTREADFMIGGFFDRYHADWAEEELAWFEALLEEDDVDVGEEDADADREELGEYLTA